jgi:hypothetical protein
MGGTSGTTFVFLRCPDDDAEANEFRELLNRKPAQKRKALILLGTLALTSFYGAIVQGMRIFGGVIGIASLLLGALIGTSSGGIEDNDGGVRLRLDDNANESLTV